MARGVTIAGRARLEQKIKRMPDVAKRTIRSALAEQADEVVKMMKRLVPVDEGDLRDSIGWTWGRAPGGSGIVASVTSSLGGDLTITIFAGDAKKAFQARWIEFGTVNMAAQPFFHVSWRASRKSARRKVRAAVRQAVRQVAAGGN